MIVTSVRTAARKAGVLYLAVVVFGVFAELAVRVRLIVPGDAAATAARVLEAELLFRLGLVSDLLMATFFLLLPFALYRIFRTQNRTQASLMVIFAVASVPVLALNTLNQLAALVLLKDPSYLSVLQAGQREALALFFLTMHGHGYTAAQIFFGLWLFPLGLLVIRSRHFPTVLGVLLILSSVSQLIVFFAHFVLPETRELVSAILMAPAGLGEIIFCLWLVARGALSPNRSGDQSRSPQSSSALSQRAGPASGGIPRNPKSTGPEGDWN